MSSNIVVVAHNRSLSLGLAGQDFDVVDLHPVELDEWLTNASEPPALLVVGVEQPGEALDIVTAASGRHPDMPTLVVSSTAQGWEGLELPGAHLAVLPLPVTRGSLVAAAHGLLAGARLPAIPLVPEPLGTAEPGALAAVTAMSIPPTDEPAAPAAVRHLVASRSTDALRERLAQRPARAAGDGSPRHPDTTFDAAALRSVEPDATTPQPRPVSPRPTPDVALELRRLVEGLLDSVDRLHEVRDAATAVAEEAVSAAEATSGVVMLPDGDVWRVAGAIGVRPLEWRYVVESDSWLVATVVTGDRGVIVEDSDIARQRLGGAPLAHLSQLLAAPIEPARGLVLVAREGAAFTEDQLGRVADISKDSGMLLADSLRVRDLARVLSDFRGLDS